MREDGSCEAMALGKSKTVFFMCVCKGDMCNKGENHTNYREFWFGGRIFKVRQIKKLLVLEKEKEYTEEMSEDEDYVYGDYYPGRGERGKMPSVTVHLHFLELFMNIVRHTDARI